MLAVQSFILRTVSSLIYELDDIIRRHMNDVVCDVCMSQCFSLKHFLVVKKPKKINKFLFKNLFIIKKQLHKPRYNYIKIENFMIYLYNI